jgi:hypothetical protein
MAAAVRVASTVPALMAARGIAGCCALSSLSAMTVPPLSFTTRAPAAPSLPVPLRTTAMTRPGRAKDAVEKRWSMRRGRPATGARSVSRPSGERPSSAELGHV